MHLWYIIFALWDKTTEYPEETHADKNWIVFEPSNSCCANDLASVLP